MESDERSQLDIIQYQLKTMAFSVENSVKKSVHSLTNFDYETARLVIEEDKSVNSFEIDIDNSTFRFLALALDRIEPDVLRYVMSVQKLNPILERIGDHSVNIAESVVSLVDMNYNNSLFAIDTMSEQCIEILHDALRSLFDADPSLANDVLSRDTIVDNQYDSIIEELKETLLTGESALSFDACFTLFRICKDLERISDLSMNIAEEVMYVYEGIVVKHQGAMSRI